MSFRRFVACLVILAVPALRAGAFGARHFKSGPIQITADGRWVWVVNPDNDSVSRIDTSNDIKPLLEELSNLESRAEKISVPLSFADELYALRSNIQLVRKKLQRS